MAKKVQPSKALTGDVIDITPDNPEVALMVQQGGSITSFFAGVRKFFAEATELERAAKSELEVARKWVKPTNGDEDRALVALVRHNAAATREIESKWEIATAFHHMHRRLTAERDRGIKVRKEIAEIGARLHAQYEADEKRRVEEENRRKQDEADRKAREDRDKELAAMEAKALEAEASSPALSAREERFVEVYMTSQNGVTAARAAGYKTPDASAVKLLSTPKIVAAIDAKRQAEAIRKQADARKAAPVIVEEIAEEKADVASGGRGTWKATVYDLDVFIHACLDPMERTRYGIPSDIVTEAMWLMLKDGTAPILNDYARQLEAQMNRWPGVTAKRTTSLV